ncbi:MAG TPA: helix-turn-helix domain-containing protein [Pseudonocardia sp.]|nr:helix-turn-helix domain-containing protein [Pseudonocardia sp.]
MARELGLSVRTIQRYVRTGKLRPDLVTPGRQWRWDVQRVRRELREYRPREQGS